MNKPPFRDVLSADEVREALLVLDDQERGDIKLAAQRLVAYSPFFDSADDLINQTILSYLEEEGKKVPRNEEFVAVFIMGMKNISSQEVRKAKRHAAIGDQELDGFHDENPEYVFLRKEDEHRVANKIKKIQEHFRNDNAVIAILMAYEEGKKLPEISECLEIPLKELDAGRKRLKRWRERQGWKPQP